MIAEKAKAFITDKKARRLIEDVIDTARKTPADDSRQRDISTHFLTASAFLVFTNIRKADVVLWKLRRYVIIYLRTTVEGRLAEAGRKEVFCEDARMHHKEKVPAGTLLSKDLPWDEGPAEHDELLYPQHLYRDRKISGRTHAQRDGSTALRLYRDTEV
jgi:hypothetical protein